MNAVRQTLVLVWDNLNTHVSPALAELITAQDWLTVYRLPPYAHELNPVEQAWSDLERSQVNQAKRNLAQLTTLVKTRLRRMQYRPARRWPAPSPVRQQGDAAHVVTARRAAVWRAGCTSCSW